MSSPSGNQAKYCEEKTNLSAKLRGCAVVADDDICLLFFAVGTPLRSDPPSHGVKGEAIAFLDSLNRFLPACFQHYHKVKELVRSSLIHKSSLDDNRAAPRLPIAPDPATDFTEDEGMDNRVH